MKILILGGDGYIGWPATIHFANLGHEVMTVDNYIKRHWEDIVNVKPLINLKPLKERVDIYNQQNNTNIQFSLIDLTNNKTVYNLFDQFTPDAIIHYGEQPSAPYSMIDREKAIESQTNNVNGTMNILFAMKKYCPDAHLIKLGTMGEYGTPNIDIEDGWIEINHNGRKDRMLYPKKPGSFYHLSKVHDSHNIEFCCRIWGLKATDLNQGIVYGINSKNTNTSEYSTSFHYDSIFGTVFNRFISQVATNKKMTVYGNGSQTRTYLNLNDSLQCAEIAVNNPPAKGEFRVLNQYTESFSVMELAELIKDSLGSKTGADIELLPNPRIEQENHYYNPTNKAFIELGLSPNKLNQNFILEFYETITKFSNYINQSYFYPNVKWDNKEK